MYRAFAVVSTLALTLCSALAHTTALDDEAASLAQEFVGRLQPQLKQAMEEGGPGMAIEVCSHQAPLIADTLSAESGWIIKRVSLKSRNASRAVPDQWERAVLEDFDRRAAAGESPVTIHYSETTPSHYRHLQAQGAEGLCLMCHGKDLAPTVNEALELYYPDDMATGYTAGQVRGAISLTKSISR
ncbi:DUF3365 domain-containing protein [Halioglobus maricola]|uniref:DUF3365 domain-containing protein n=1 Tax=Halioglobus maricola TaxID=2601894 RepID=A0A5P9NJA1_9GAMM|nr:DUF3365 domain-containing protein [Halioglobus maricola]QFU75847.1 DUF3365 domain-containing protein [Halioglobus maricola]